MNCYTGIGSRKTPREILALMAAVAAELAKMGWILRSGGADGADSAFEIGAVSRKEVYLPWKGFNGRNSPYYLITAAALAMAEKYHPAWDRCSPGARKLHARNCYQVLGFDLNTPSNFILCWTPSGKVEGGTGQAMRIALDNNIPIINMYHTDWRDKVHELTGLDTSLV